MRYSIEEVRKYGMEIVGKLGMSEEDAYIFIDNLLTADCRGIHSHGFAKFHGYVDRLEKKLTSATAQPEIIIDNKACFVVDGNNAMGTTTAARTMQWCMEKAREYGIGMAAVKNGSHYGFGGYFTIMAAKENMIGMDLCDCPALVAPFGGSDRMLGTNPISVSIPAGLYSPFVMDMATSVVAKGKIALALKEKQSIPEGWALDKNGNPTIDPKEADEGVLLPMAGPKGYALSMIVDLLCANLAGACNSREIELTFQNPTRPSGIGYVFMAVDPSKFVDINVFKESNDRIFKEFKESTPAAGFSEVMIPGEPEYKKEQESRTKGVEITPEVSKELTEIGEKYNVQFPLSL